MFAGWYARQQQRRNRPGRLSHGAAPSRHMGRFAPLRPALTLDSIPLMHDILIIGGGFAGVWSALGAAAARRELGAHAARLRIALLTREPYLTIRPRLY